MKTSFPSRSSRSAFTLIELLVVIAIIAILAAMLFPAIGVAKRKAAEASARADMANIGLAIGRYEADYNGRFPAPGIPTGTDDVTFGYVATPTADMRVISVATNSGVMAVLLNLEKFNNGVATANQGHVLNPRGLTSLDAKIAADTSSQGIGPDGEYRDPWGTPYVISMDTSLDDQCRDIVYSRRSVSQDSGQKGLFGLSNPSGGVDQFQHNGKYLIWSLGADRKASITQNPNPPPFGSAKVGVNKDNLLSWQ